jgi:large subunit ribosomal protein L25
MAAHARPQLKAESRYPGRKSDLRSMRQAGLIPGSLFGHGEPESIRIREHDLREHLRHHAMGGIVDVVVDGRTTPALLREMDKNPITGEVITLGFQRVDMQETIKASLPIMVTGDEGLIKQGLVLTRALDHLDVHGRADALPEAISVDVSGCGAGQTIRIGDLPLPNGVEASKDADLPVLTVSTPTIDAAVAAALDAEEAAHEAERAAHGTEEEEEETVATA